MDEKAVTYLKKYGNPDTFSEDMKQLEQGIPVQYIVGNVDFYGYEFIVNSDVLIPRFETEELVSRTIRYCQKLHLDQPKIIDLGTGSGCIAITLAKEIPNSHLTAVDISKKALNVAKQNALKNHVNITWLESDMLNCVTGKFDVMISNPPYIATSEEIDQLVFDYEPHLALFAQDYGLYFYKQILKEAHQYLRIPSLIAFEIGEKQGKQIVDIAKLYFPNALIHLEQDLQKRDRFIFIEHIK
ncbi:MAG: peptide chain release factor N(5)-glutamine methyltransferase [Bacilli bacterium]|jgi:release factor glutamine methyltransferase|nr:peptide chain release factor N(5)-glutamine methyltransferase [Bacilli bacterium]